MTITCRLDMKRMKGGGMRHRLCYCGTNEDFYIIPTGMYLIKITQGIYKIYIYYGDILTTCVIVIHGSM